jgi:hypothetical protein
MLPIFPFILAGIKKHLFCGEPIIGISCPNCQETEQEPYGIQKYFHIFFIPVFPLARSVGMMCSHCLWNQNVDTLPEDLGSRIRRDVFRPIRLLPFFSGTILILFSLFWVFHVTGEWQERDTRILSNPRIADMYVIDIKYYVRVISREKTFCLVKVIDVDQTTVICVVSKSSYVDYMGPTRDIDTGRTWGAGYFSDETIRLLRRELLAMEKNDIIRSVVRPSDNGIILW